MFARHRKEGEVSWAWRVWAQWRGCFLCPRGNFRRENVEDSARQAVISTAIVKKEQRKNARRLVSEKKVECVTQGIADTGSTSNQYRHRQECLDRCLKPIQAKRRPKNRQRESVVPEAISDTSLSCKSVGRIGRAEQRPSFRHSPEYAGLPHTLHPSHRIPLSGTRDETTAQGPTALRESPPCRCETCCATLLQRTCSRSSYAKRPRGASRCTCGS